MPLGLCRYLNFCGLAFKKSENMAIFAKRKSNCSHGRKNRDILTIQTKFDRVCKLSKIIFINLNILFEKPRTTNFKIRLSDQR